MYGRRPSNHNYGTGGYPEWHIHAQAYHKKPYHVFKTDDLKIGIIFLKNKTVRIKYESEKILDESEIKKYLYKNNQGFDWRKAEYFSNIG